MEHELSLALVACPGGAAFAEKIDRYLYSRYTNAKLTGTINPQSFLVPCRHTVFANGEIKAEVGTSIRGKHVFIIQDVTNSQPIELNGTKQRFSINDNLLSLFVTLDAVRSSGAERVSLILPYFPYSRQHVRKGREGLTAARISRQLEDLGADRIITLDIHCKEIENAFRKTNLEDLHASYQILRELLYKVKRKDLMIVSPDVGGLGRNRFFANALGCRLGAIYKERDYGRTSNNAEDNNIINMRLLGNVDKATVFIADDILGTGGTMIKAMSTIKEHGAKDILLGISLPLFNGNAIEHFDRAYDDGLFSYLIGTNGVMLPPEVLTKPWFIEADVSKFFGQVIDRIYHNHSVTDLLDNRKMISRLFSRHPNLE
ncbi:ribose-phosphate diphosphokinase [Candidatus Haliotispira prima]|uniref:ribose-phosphate diphosphokinase n=1 Tax=Candidatus Haliotispira prima TaxID=3034016 RepID=A0ABY8MH20_9SPIO|nr:ribose-phosphate diphosphokinase [Candidatus Haliotispira prima]